jgi:hypothetical protein
MDMSDRREIDVAYSGCQKNVPVFKRFFLQPLMPQFRHSEHYYGKRYKPISRSISEPKAAD